MAITGEQIDIDWIKNSLQRIERKIDNLNLINQNHEKRIARLEGANKIWITLTGMIATMTGILGGIIGHLI